MSISNRYSLKSRKVKGLRGTYPEYSIWDNLKNRSYGSQTTDKEDADKLCKWLNSENKKIN